MAYIKNRIIHRFIRDITEYLENGICYGQVLPADTQVYANYSKEAGQVDNDSNPKVGLYYVIGDGVHTYTEIRDGHGKNNYNKEYVAFEAGNIPEKLSELENDTGFITITDVTAQNYTTMSAVEAKGYLTSEALMDYALKTDIPSKTSELTNDNNFTTLAAVAEQGYAKASELPTRVSDLENDEGYVKASAVPSKISQLTNDSNFTTLDAVASQGYLTSITSAQVVGALGYTPYDSTNSNEYQTSAQVQSAISGKANTSDLSVLALSSNVDISGVTTGQGLIWNGTKWANDDIAASVSFSNITGNITDNTSAKTALDAKQDKLTTAQLNVVDSGITKNLVTQIGTNSSNITALSSDIASNTADINRLKTSKQDTITDLEEIRNKANNSLPNTIKYGSSISMTIDNSSYIVKLQLKDQNEDNLGDEQSIDLPLESVVVSGEYDATTKEVVLTLQDKSTIRFSVADLVSGLQSEITSENKLSSDLVDDTGKIHKFVSDSEKTAWNNKQDIVDDLTTIRSGAAAGATAIQPATLNDYAKTSALPTKTSQLANDSNYTTLAAVASEGYTKNVGTVTKVNNTSPDANGNVTISIPSKTSDLTNDSDFMTATEANETIGTLSILKTTDKTNLVAAINELYTLITNSP